jgi:hypothetical protein
MRSTLHKVCGQKLLCDCPKGICCVQVAKTAAQRQANRKAREIAAGRVQWKRWVHKDDVAALTEYAEKLSRKRMRLTRSADAL